jgi:hypothetical protein
VAVPHPENPDKPRTVIRGADLQRENPLRIVRRRDGTRTLAVAGDRVLVGASVTDNDQHREG